jgi:hypothetical protein
VHDTFVHTFSRLKMAPDGLTRRWDMDWDDVLFAGYVCTF